jgi:uncharacterized membrane protein
MEDIAMTKTASFAVVHFSVAFSVGYIMTGSIAVGGAIALVEPMVNTVAYFFHEKVWERLSARQKESPSGISGRMARI